MTFRTQPYKGSGPPFLFQCPPSLRPPLGRGKKTVLPLVDAFSKRWLMGCDIPAKGCFDSHVLQLCVKGKDGSGSQKRMFKFS